MSADNRGELFVRSGVFRGDQERYARYLNAVVAEEGIQPGDILGVAENPHNHLVVVTRTVVARAAERGLFRNKRIEVTGCPVASIANVRTHVKATGPHRGDLTLSCTNDVGDTLFEAEWGITSGDLHGENATAHAQAQQMLDLIAEAMKTWGAPGRPSVATASSRADALREWATDVVAAAGVEVTPARVEEHASMIAADIAFTVFLRRGAPYGIDALSQFYPHGTTPSATSIEGFDDLYAHVVQRLGDAAGIDRDIDEQLTSAWTNYVNGCREAYS